MNIFELLSKIKWDPNEKPEEYVIYYYDRVENKNKEIRFTEIKEFNSSYFYIVKNGKDIAIPLHRIREVRRDGKLIWKR